MREPGAVAIAATYLFFYVFASGFGTQYLSLAVPFLVVSSIRMTTIYVAGISPFLLTNYLQASLYDKYGGLDSAPLTSRLSSLTRGDLALVALNGVLAIVAWATCAWLLWQTARRNGCPTARPQAAIRRHP